MLGSLLLYLKGMRIMMFQLSGYYYIDPLKVPQSSSFLGVPCRILNTVDGQNPALPIIRNIPKFP